MNGAAISVFVGAVKVHMSSAATVVSPPPDLTCTVYRKTVEENADDHILTKQYFPRAHREERRELKTGLIVVRANSGQLFDRERVDWDLVLGTLLYRGPPN